MFLQSFSSRQFVFMQSPEASILTEEPKVLVYLPPFPPLESSLQFKWPMAACQVTIPTGTVTGFGFQLGASIALGLNNCFTSMPAWLSIEQKEYIFFVNYIYIFYRRIDNFLTEQQACDVQMNQILLLRKEPILGYVPKNDEKNNSGGKGLKKVRIYKFV